MPTDVLSERQRLVETLSGDLLAGPWMQPNKLWFLKGQEGDEWLEYVGDFTGTIESRLTELVCNKALPTDAIGVCVASESFDYPAAVAEKLRTKDASAKSAYASLMPADEHPQRVEVRNLMLACRDGEVIGLSTRHEAAQNPQWAHLSKTVPCPTGNKAIDTARALLGSYPELLTKIEGSSDQLRLLKAVDAALTEALSGDIDQREATVKLLEAMTPEQRADIIEGMPRRIRDEVGSYLTDEQRERYGL